MHAKRKKIKKIIKEEIGKITPEQAAEDAFLESLHPIFCHFRQKHY